MADKFLDKEGLQIVADNTNLRVKIVTEVPSTPRNNMVILYDGTDTADFTKGSMYKYNGVEWESLADSAEEIYNPTSSKAQSGKAVDMAVRKFITDNTSLVWETKTWDITIVNASYVWKDTDNNIYYSKYPNDYKLNKSTNEWDSITVTGLGLGSGIDLWTDGANVYYSSNGNNYIFDSTNLAWIQITWTGLTNFKGKDVWYDRNDVYYSSGANIYKLDKSTSIWQPVENTQGISIIGEFIWSDGINTYYSRNVSQNPQHLVLDRETFTWNTKSWNVGFNGNTVWSDGNDVYCIDINDNSKILNKTTSTWEDKTWNVNIISSKNYIWNDGENIYYSNNSNQYVAHRKFNTLIK